MLTIRSVQLIWGLTFSSHGVPRITFSFPQLMMWNRTWWMIPLMQINKFGGDELDDPRFVVQSIYVSGTDRLGESVVGYLVFLDEAPVEAID